MLYRKVHSAKIIWYEKVFIIFLAPCSASKSPNSKRRFLKKNQGFVLFITELQFNLHQLSTTPGELYIYQFLHPARESGQKNM